MALDYKLQKNAQCHKKFPAFLQPQKCNGFIMVFASLFPSWRLRPQPRPSRIS